MVTKCQYKQHTQGLPVCKLKDKTVKTLKLQLFSILLFQALYGGTKHIFELQHPLNMKIM